MAGSRIVVIDPEEGVRIAERLRGAGFDVQEVSLAAGPEVLDAALAVVALDAPRGPEVATQVFRAGVQTFLLGDEPVSGLPAPYPRPVPLDALLELARRVSRAASSLGYESTRVAAEHTMDLGPADVPSPAGEGRDSGPKLSAELLALLEEADRRLFPGTAALALEWPGGDEAPDRLVPDEVLDAVTSPVEGPAFDPLDAFTFVGVVLEPGAGAPARALPEAPAPPASPVEAGAAPGPERGEKEPASAKRREARSGVMDRGGVAGRSTGSKVERIAAIAPDAARGSATPPRTVSGPLARLSWLWAAMTAGGEACFRMAPASGEARTPARPDRDGWLELTVTDGRLSSIDGPLARRALDAVRRAARFVEAPDDEDDEAEARRRLEASVRAGEVDRFECERRLREAGDELLVELLARPECTLEPLASTDAWDHGAVGDAGIPASPVMPEPWPLAPRLAGRRPALPWLAEAARRAWTPSMAVELAGGRALRAGAGAKEALEQMQLEPELQLLLERCDGARLDSWLERGPEDLGLPGLLALLLASGHADLDAAPTGSPPPSAVTSRTAEQAVRAAYELAVDGDYFAVLGLDRPGGPEAGLPSRPAIAHGSAGPPEPRDRAPGRAEPPITDPAPFWWTARTLRDAYERRRRELMKLRLGELGLAHLEALRHRALEALDEAYEVLRSDALRAAYAAALR
jgi:hypothetical protein